MRRDLVTNSLISNTKNVNHTCRFYGVACCEEYHSLLIPLCYYQLRQLQEVWQDIVFEAVGDEDPIFWKHIMEPAIEELQGITIKKMISWISSMIMIFGGVIPYIPQYKEIYVKEDADGFSLYVCLALLVANTLRILFWFGKKYELPLLFQSIVMNVMMLIMVHLCVRVKNKNQVVRLPDKVFTDFDWKFIWQWTDFLSYIEFLLSMSISLALLTCLLIQSSLYVETIGFLAVFTEAMLGVPQLVRNFQQKSTEGMSLVMVMMWTAGDAFKTVYFIARQSPMQFWLCGSLQVMIDVSILAQVYWYRLNIASLRSTRSD